MINTSQLLDDLSLEELEQLIIKLKIMCVDIELKKKQYQDSIQELNKIISILKQENSQ